MNAFSIVYVLDKAISLPSGKRHLYTQFKSVAFPAMYENNMLNEYHLKMG